MQADAVWQPTTATAAAAAAARAAAATTATAAATEAAAAAAATPIATATTATRTATTTAVRCQCNKAGEHQTLISALQKYGYDVQMKTLTMGHGGCLYHTSKETLTSVGIKEENTIQVRKKVHTYSIKCLHNILIERRKTQQIT